MFGRHFARNLRHDKQRVSPFYHDLELDLVGLIGNFEVVEQLVHLVNSFIQSCLKEIFGGIRGDSYTFSNMTFPVSILTTFGIQ